MKLLKYENYQVVPTEECFMIKPLRELFNEDTSTDKELLVYSLILNSKLFCLAVPSIVATTVVPHFIIYL